MFCGRILVFLAKFFPVSERSGLNVISEFNVENTTVFGAEGMEEEDKEEGKNDREEAIIDEDEKK